MQMESKIYPHVKRAFDILSAGSALLFLSPLLLIVAAAIRLESKGPVIYRSKRVGQHYRIFDLFKFRTMYVGADKNTELMKKLNQYDSGTSDPLEDSTGCPYCKAFGRPCSPMLHADNEVVCENFYLRRKGKVNAFYKIKNDPRVTPLGRLLRKTSIDELPQLINVLRGDMSLIGNRPLPLYEAEKLTSDNAIERFNSPAGLTGLWQVMQRGKAEVSEEERIHLDKLYARTWSLKQDIKILLKTIPALIQKENV